MAKHGWPLRQIMASMTLPQLPVLIILDFLVVQNWSWIILHDLASSATGAENLKDSQPSNKNSSTSQVGSDMMLPDSRNAGAVRQNLPYQVSSETL